MSVTCSQCQSQISGEHVSGCQSQLRKDRLLELIADELIMLDIARERARRAEQRIDAWRREYDAL